MENSENVNTVVEETTNTEQQETQVENAEEGVERSLEKAIEFKNLGNESFKKQEFEKAIEEYKDGLRFCPKDEEKTAAVLYSNCASCYFNLADYNMCIECATQSISLNKEYLRPVLCRAGAYYELEKWEESHEDYQAAEKLDPESVQKPDIQRKLNILKKKIDDLTEVRKNEVMGNLKDLGNTLLGKFGLSLDNFKMQQNENGSYNIAFQK